jgi:hypothetical protein
MATVNHLGPKTFPLPYGHERHHEWLAHFTPAQRKELVSEDLRARTQIATVLGACMVTGLIGLSLLLVEMMPK